MKLNKLNKQEDRGRDKFQDNIKYFSKLNNLVLGY
jgi:hypothetical protein